MNRYKNWSSQLNKGFLELCILTLLNDKALYGAQIIDALHNVGIDAAEGTLYPLLNRMHDNGFLTSHWSTPDKHASRHPTRIYQTNAVGKDLHTHLQDFYQRNDTALRSLLQMKG